MYRGHDYDTEHNSKLFEDLRHTLVAGKSVTVVGPHGSGKLQVVRRVMHRLGKEALEVSVKGCTTCEEVLQAVAEQMPHRGYSETQLYSTTHEYLIDNMVLPADTVLVLLDSAVDVGWLFEGAGATVVITHTPTTPTPYTHPRKQHPAHRLYTCNAYKDNLPVAGYRMKQAYEQHLAGWAASGTYDVVPSLVHHLYTNNAFTPDQMMVLRTLANLVPHVPHATCVFDGQIPQPQLELALVALHNHTIITIIDLPRGVCVEVSCGVVKGLQMCVQPAPCPRGPPDDVETVHKQCTAIGNWTCDREEGEDTTSWVARACSTLKGATYIYKCYYCTVGTESISEVVTALLRNYVEEDNTAKMACMLQATRQAGCSNVDVLVRCLVHSDPVLHCLAHNIIKHSFDASGIEPLAIILSQYVVSYGLRIDSRHSFVTQPVVKEVVGVPHYLLKTHLEALLGALPDVLFASDNAMIAEALDVVLILLGRDMRKPKKPTSLLAADGVELGDLIRGCSVTVPRETIDQLVHVVVNNRQEGLRQLAASKLAALTTTVRKYISVAAMQHLNKGNSRYLLQVLDLSAIDLPSLEALVVLSLTDTDAKQVLGQSALLANTVVPLAVKHEAWGSLPLLQHYSGDLGPVYQAYLQGSVPPHILRSAGDRMALFIMDSHPDAHEDVYPVDASPDWSRWVMNKQPTAAYLTQCSCCNDVIARHMETQQCVDYRGIDLMEVLAARTEVLTNATLDVLVPLPFVYSHACFSKVISRSNDCDYLVSRLLDAGLPHALPLGMQALTTDICTVLFERVLQGDDHLAEVLSTLVCPDHGFLCEVAEMLWPHPADELVRYPARPCTLWWRGGQEFRTPDDESRLSRDYCRNRHAEHKTADGCVYLFPPHAGYDEVWMAPLGAQASHRDDYWQTHEGDGGLLYMHVPYLQYGVLVNGCVTVPDFAKAARPYCVKTFAARGVTGKLYHVAFTKDIDSEVRLKEHIKATKPWFVRLLRESFLARGELLQLLSSLPADFSSVPFPLVERVFDIITLNVSVERGSSILKSAEQHLRTRRTCPRHAHEIAQLLGEEGLPGDVVTNIISSTPGLGIGPNNLLHVLAAYADNHDSDVREAVHEFANRCTFRKGYFLSLLIPFMNDTVVGIYTSNVAHLTEECAKALITYATQLIRKGKDIKDIAHIMSTMHPDLQEVAAAHLLEAGTLDWTTPTLHLIPTLAFVPKEIVHQAVYLALDDIGILYDANKLQALQALFRRTYSPQVTGILAERLSSEADPTALARILACFCTCRRIDLPEVAKVTLEALATQYTPMSSTALQVLASACA